MGASLQTIMFADHLGQTAINQMWDDLCEQSRHDHGHSYSGDIGMLRGSPRWTDTPYFNEDEAHSYIRMNHDKWDPPIAVSYTEDGVKFWLIGGFCSE